MVIVENQWSPDTCSCVLKYTFDSESSENDRVHTFSQVVNVCPEHKDLLPTSPAAAKNMKSLKTIYDTVLEENQRKNYTLQKILENKPELADLIDGKTQKRYDAVSVTKQLGLKDAMEVSDKLGVGLTLKEDIEYKWEFVKEEEVTITTTDSKKQINNNNKKRVLEVDFDVPITIDRAIAAKTTEKSLIKQKAIPDIESLQSILDSEFNESKGKGKVRLRVANF